MAQRGRITEEERQRGISGLQTQMGGQSTQISGRMGFAAFGMAIQDALLKDDTAKLSLKEQQRQTKLQEMMARSLENPPTRNAGFPEQSGGGV